MGNSSQSALSPAARKILQASHHAPFEYLGRHNGQLNGQQKTVIRVILPNATSASLIEPALEFQRLDGNIIFELTITDTTIPKHYTIEWTGSDGATHRHHDSYSFSAQIPEDELALFIKGMQYDAGEILGAHTMTADGIKGVLFATWAPNAERVSVVGNFNGWDGRCHMMRTRGASGIWEVFIPGLPAGEPYQFELRNHHKGTVQLKPDPYAQQLELSTNNHAIVTSSSEHQWKDQQWMIKREFYDWQHKPISIYEVHLDSWQRDSDGSSLNYRALAKQLVTYLHEAGFTHLQLFSESLIESGCGFFAPSSRHGTPDDFRYFIDYCHQHRVGVILSWHIDQLQPNADNLNFFDGESLYEQSTDNPSQFDYSKNGVRSFLKSSALFWLDAYHIDGLKLRTTTSMLYQNDQQNDGALSLLRELNDLAYQRHPGVLMQAEENTVWPMVTQPTGLGGLGFSMKWNGGWRHDTLGYLAHEAPARPVHHETLVFSHNYAFSENFILPFSNQSHALNKSPLLQQMPGKEPQRFANLRLLYSYMFTHPGKKLLFMGNEFASNRQWNSQESLPWALADKALHSGLSRMVTELNSLYRNTPALHYYDFHEKGFEWIDRHDSSQSLIVFQRNAEESSIIVALNFSATTRNAHRIGVVHDTIYKEIFNSDAYRFGGKDRLNISGIPAENLPWMKQPFSITITLPPLSAVIIKPLHKATMPTTPC